MVVLAGLVMLVPPLIMMLFFDDDRTLGIHSEAVTCAASIPLSCAALMRVMMEKRLR